jgi:hypothetical protein
LFRLSLSVVETPLSATFHLTLAETPLSAIVSFCSVAETPLSATLHHFFDAETPRSALLISSELEHHCSAVLHLQHLLHLSLLPKHQSFTIVRQQAFIVRL